MEKYYISKELSTVVKGIAIILMLIHHIFTFPDWIVVDGGYSPNLIFADYFNSPTKLCVCIFAFVTGWAYAVNKNRTINYALKKIIKFLITFWLVAIPLIAVAVLFCNYRPDILNIITELTGLSSVIMVFCWYVSFYIVSMIILPLLSKALDKNIFIALLAGVVLPIALLTLLNAVIHQSNLNLLINNLRHWFPCICVGYICNNYDIFAKIKKLTKRINSVLILFFALIICFVGRYFFAALDFIYCAVLVFAISNVFNGSENIVKKVIARIFSAFGSVSTNIWFLHCAFFSTVTREMFQPLIYWSANPIIVFACALLILYAFAFVFTKLDSLILKRL